MTSGGTPIELGNGNGDCPRCGRPVLSPDREVCVYCGQDLQSLDDVHPEIQQKLASIAPGWDASRLRSWIECRATQLAWAITNGAWPCLSGWVDEPLWRRWESVESHRRASGQMLRMGEVSLFRIRIKGLNESDSSVRVGLRGLRSCYVVDGRTKMVVSGLRGAKPFGELWTLQTTGFPDPTPTQHCQSCGAPAEFDTHRCAHCGCWLLSQPEPWRLNEVENLPSAALRCQAIADERPNYHFFHRPDEETFSQILMDHLAY